MVINSITISVFIIIGFYVYLFYVFFICICFVVNIQVGLGHHRGSTVPRSRCSLGSLPKIVSEHLIQCFKLYYQTEKIVLCKFMFVPCTVGFANQSVCDVYLY